MKHYRSKAAFRKAAAYVHIHHVPHHPQKTVEIAGRKYHPQHRGEKVGSCAYCNSSHHSTGKHHDLGGKETDMKIGRHLSRKDYGI